MAYPEHEKLKLIQDKSQLLHEFLLEFCDEKGIFLAEYNNRDDAMPVRRVPKLIAEFFEIDEVALENEKLAMIDVMRKANEPTT